jgi:hypothetical protein
MQRPFAASLDGREVSSTVGRVPPDCAEHSGPLSEVLGHLAPSLQRGVSGDSTLRPSPTALKVPVQGARDGEQPDVGPRRQTRQICRSRATYCPARGQSALEPKRRPRDLSLSVRSAHDELIRCTKRHHRREGVVPECCWDLAHPNHGDGVGNNARRYETVPRDRVPRHDGALRGSGGLRRSPRPPPQSPTRHATTGSKTSS